MKSNSFFIKYKYFIIPALLVCIIYNSTQPIVENLTAEQKKKAVEQEKKTLKHLDAALNSFEGVMKHMKQKQQANKLSSKSIARINKVIKALDQMENWLNTAVVTTIFSNEAKDQKQYNQKIAGLFNQQGDQIKLIKERIIFIRNALKSYKSSGGSKKKSGGSKKKKGGMFG